MWLAIANSPRAEDTVDRCCCTYYRSALQMHRPSRRFRCRPCNPAFSARTSCSFGSLLLLLLFDNHIQQKRHQDGTPRLRTIHHALQEISNRQLLLIPLSRFALEKARKQIHRSRNESQAVEDNGLDDPSAAHELVRAGAQPLEEREQFLPFVGCTLRRLPRPIFPLAVRPWEGNSPTTTSRSRPVRAGHRPRAGTHADLCQSRGTPV